MSPPWSFSELSRSPVEPLEFWVARELRGGEEGEAPSRFAVYEGSRCGETMSARLLSSAEGERSRFDIVLEVKGYTGLHKIRCVREPFDAVLAME